MVQAIMPYAPLRRWTISKTGLPTNVQSAAATWTLIHGGGSLAKAGSVTNNTDSITLTLELTAAETAAFIAGAGSFHWNVVMATTSYVHTIQRNGVAVITAA